MYYAITRRSPDKSVFGVVFWCLMFVSLVDIRIFA